MGLPFILDVAIGLIFIYLILSLLASELQELITTLLQWRAKHLKESIEVLLAGGAGTQREEKVVGLVDKLYNDPLLKNINQEAKGLLAQGFRRLTRLFKSNKVGAFGEHQSTGPSYIASETFATSLLERLGLATLSRKLVEVRLEKFKGRIVGLYDDGVTIPSDDDDRFAKSNWNKGEVRIIAEKAGKHNLNLDENFRVLVEEYDDIVKDFKSGRASLETCVDRMGDSLETYISSYPPPNLKPAEPADSSSAAQPIANSNSTTDAWSTAPAEFATESSVEGFDQPPLTPADQMPANYAGENAGMAMGEDPAGAVSAEGAHSQEASPPKREDLAYFVRRLQFFKFGIFGKNNDRAILAGGLRPSLYEIAELINRSSSTYQEVDAAYEEIRVQGPQLLQQVQATARTILDEENVRLREETLDEPLVEWDQLDNEDRRLRINQAMSRLRLSPEQRRLYDEYETYQSIQAVLNVVPSSVRESLAILARRAQTKVHRAGEEIDQFQAEVALWFDRSMSRASGVYKRNAKGVAIAIGISLALITNSDTTYIIGRLSNDENLRQVISEQAANLAAEGRTAPATKEELRALKENTDAVLKELPLPIGWLNKANRSQQFSRPLAIPQAIIGWIVSGIAIAMGAPFWFDLLGKVVNVRNSGGKPPSPAAEKASTKD